MKIKKVNMRELEREVLIRKTCEVLRMLGTINLALCVGDIRVIVRGSAAKLKELVHYLKVTE